MATTPQTEQPQQQALTVLDRKVINVRQRLSQLGIPKKIELSLPKGLDPIRFFNCAMTEIRRNPDLLDCEPDSVAGAIVQAAEVGLEINRNLGQCWLIPYKKTCELQYGYRGLIQLAWRTDRVKTLYAASVREGEYFDYQRGTGDNFYLKHRPDQDLEDEPFTHFYACVEYVNGGFDFEVLTIKAVQKRRARSKSPDSPAWKNDFEAMAKSKPLATLIKRMPVSAQNQQLMQAAYLTELTDTTEVLQGNEALVGQEPKDLPKPSTQDFQASHSTQQQVSSLTDLHTKPVVEMEGSQTATSDPSQPQESSLPPQRTPAPGAQDQPFDSRKAVEQVVEHNQSLHLPRRERRATSKEPQGVPVDFKSRAAGNRFE